MGTVVAVMTAVAALTVGSMVHVLGDYRATSTRAAEHVDDLVALRATVEVMREQSAAGSDGVGLVAFEDTIDTLMAELDGYMSASGSSPSTAVVAGVRDHLAEIHAQLGSGGDPLVTADHLAALDRLLAKLDEAIALEPVRALDHAEATTRATVFRVVALWAVGAVVALIAVRRLHRAVLPRLAALGRIAGRLGEGELTARVDVGPDDEIGRVAHAFNGMADRLAQAHAALERKAHTDELTGLATRHLFWERLEAATAGAASERNELVVLFVDVDGFKAVNDHHGHDAGDELLRAVGERLVCAVRAGDTVARLGGDEFAVIAPGLPPSDEQRVVRRVRRALSTAVVVDGVPVAISASVGAARWQAGLTAEALVAAADTAMYAAKRARDASAQLAS